MKKEEEIKKPSQESEKNLSEAEKEADGFDKEQELEKKDQEYERLKDKYLRLAAEFDNARKRWEREKEEIIKFGNHHFLRDFIIILDEMEQALKMARDHEKSQDLAKGLEIMLNNFVGNLKKRGLKEISAKAKAFDPHLHEIISIRDVEKQEDDSVVLEEVQKGYLFEGRVLRPAKVIVGIKKKLEIKEEGGEKEEEKDKKIDGEQNEKQ